MSVIDEHICLPDYNGYQLIRAFSCFVYAIPSLTAFFFVIIILRTNKSSFSPIFLHVFTLNFIYSLGCWVCDLIFTRIFSLPNVCPLVEGLSRTYALSVPYFLYNFFLVANFVSSTIIVLHQFTAIVYPLQVNQIWKKATNCITVATVLIPTLAAFHILLGEPEVLPLFSGQVYIKVVHFYNHFEVITAPSANAACGTVTAILIFTITICSGYAAFRKRHDITVKRINWKNYLISCWIGFSAIIFAIYNIALWYARFVLEDRYAIDRVVLVRGYVADICFLPLPWIIFLAKKPLRNAVINIFKSKSSSSCTSCTVGQVTFTPQDPTTVGSIPATFTGPVADAATGCLTLTAVCTATAPLIAFMQFNQLEGGPLENQGMTTVVMAPLNCINGNWVYIEGEMRIVTEVNCSEATANAGGKKKRK